MSKKHEVAAAPEAQAPAVYDGPSGISDNITTQDLRLPRVALMQALSPSVVDGTHKVGTLVNSLTQEEIKAPAIITPCFVFKNVIKWKPREQGGGMLYKTTNITADVQRDLAWVGDQKPQADAYINVVCTIAGQEGMPMIVSFCRTSYKTGQDLATLTTLFKPSWSYKYELGAKLSKNKLGQPYYIYTIKRAGKTTEAEAAEALELYKNVKGMTITTDYEGDTSTEQAPIVDQDGL